MPVRILAAFWLTDDGKDFWANLIHSAAVHRVGKRRPLEYDLEDKLIGFKNIFQQGH